MEDDRAPLRPAERHRRAPPRGQSGQLLLGADRIAAEEAYTRGEVGPTSEHHRQRALIPMHPDMAVRGIGGELVPTDSGAGFKEYQLLNTIENPTYVTADASRARLELAQVAGALEEALDAADTIEARDSLEKMLAHQLATSHVSAMSMAAQLKKQVEIAGNTVCSPDANERAILNATRLAGAVARIQAVYQQGLLTLHRLRTGGRQTVHVQHTVVGPGGKAIVAGRVTGGREGGGDLPAEGRGEGRQK
jgi:hypothetical protein